MPKVLLPESVSRLVLDMKFDVDGGSTVHNFDLEKGDQVVAHYITPQANAQERYLRVQSVEGPKRKGGKKQKGKSLITEYVSDPEACVRDCCTKVEGFGTYSITDGKTLVAHPANKVLVEVIKKIYKAIMNMDDDDDEEESI